MRWFIGFLLLVVLPLAVAEFNAACGVWAEGVVRLAARRLPKEHQEEYEEEWLGELDAKGGMNLTKMAMAIGVWFFAPFTARSLGGPRGIQTRNAVRSVQGAFARGTEASLTALSSAYGALRRPVTMTRLQRSFAAGGTAAMSGMLLYMMIGQSIIAGGPAPAFFKTGWGLLHDSLNFQGYGSHLLTATIASLSLAALSALFTSGFRHGPFWSVGTSMAVGVAGLAAMAPLLVGLVVVGANAALWGMDGIVGFTENVAYRTISIWHWLGSRLGATLITGAFGLLLMFLASSDPKSRQ